MGLEALPGCAEPDRVERFRLKDAMAHPPSVALIGYAAATFTTASFFPQAIKTVRSGDVGAISLPMYLLLTLGISLWGIYGLITGDGPLIVANAITLIPALVVLDCKLKSLRASAGTRLWRGW
jgi:MtN3 and saliva related transmembrane protein